jgi:hypothetical protein
MKLTYFLSLSLAAFALANPTPQVPSCGGDCEDCVEYALCILNGDPIVYCIEAFVSSNLFIRCGDTLTFATTVPITNTPSALSRGPVGYHAQDQ